MDEILKKGVENIFPNNQSLKKDLKNGKKLNIYLGIDPTGPDLHLGHLIPILKLREFQKLGHRTILLIGDFTAMIGDPTDKKSARTKLTKEEVKQNLKSYKKQLSNILDFKSNNKTEIIYNSKWWSKMKTEEILELTSLITVDQMIKRDMFKERIKTNKPIYIHEFLYPLMQGYDSVAMDIDLEIGGNDQTFNMLIGRDLAKTINKKEKKVLTTKILADAEGRKMSKTENNMVRLNDKPEEIYGKVMSWKDELIIPGFEFFSDLSIKEIKEKERNINKENKNPKEEKEILAENIIKLIQGEKSIKKAKNDFQQKFQNKEIPEKIDKINVDKKTKLIDILVNSGKIKSKTEAKRMINSGSITNLDDNNKIKDLTYEIDENISIKIGKKNFLSIKTK